MNTQDTSFGAPPSGLPPLAWLSGLSLGQVGLGGQQDGSLSGAGRFAEGVGAPGAEGLGLDALAQMFAAMQGGDVASAASDSPIGTGTLAQGGGTLGQANAGPTGGYAVAGQTAGAGAQQAAEGQAAGSMDPLAIIRKILGVAQKGLGGALGAGDGQGGTVGGGGYLSAGQQQPSPLGFPASGYSLAGPQEGNPLAGIAQDQQGAFLGTNVLQDPTFGPLLTQGLLTGSLTPADLSNLSTLSQDQIAGLRTALLGGDVQSDLGSQLLSGQGGTQGFTLGAGTASPTNWGGVAQGGLAGALGLLNILQSAQGGNTAQGVGGGLQGLSGLTQVLQSSPGLTQGLDGLNLPGVGGALGAAGGLTAIAQAIQSGDFSKIPGGAIGAYQGISQLLNSGMLGDSLKGVVPGISGGGVGVNPGALLGAAIQFLGNDHLSQGDTAQLKMFTDTISLLQALSAATTGVPYAALVAQGVTDAMNIANFAQGNQSLGMTAAGSIPIIGGYAQALLGQLDKPSANYINNPIVGAMYSKANEGLTQNQSLLDTIQKAGGPGSFEIQQLESALPALVNSLLPYYAGAGTTTPGARFKDSPEDAAAYTERYNQAAQGISDVVQNLLSRGVTYEQLGQLGGFAPWAYGINAAGLPEDYYKMNQGQYDASANQLLERLYGGATQTPVTAWQSMGEGGIELPTGQTQYAYNGQLLPSLGTLGASDLLKAAQGANLPGSSGQIESMYGGPLWTALARMGIAPGVLSGPGGLISQHFNPWANIQSRTGSELFDILNPYVLQPMALFGLGGPGGIAEGEAAAPASPD